MASQAIHFAKAPIVEAVIGIDFEASLPVEVLNDLRRLGDHLAPEYPTTENLIVNEVKIQPGSPIQQIENHLGFFFKSADGLQVIHAKRSGFAFSRLRPYENWDAFVSEAKRTWSLYRSVITAANLATFNVRYINKLSWPNGENIEDYLAIYPHLPEGIPQSLSSCFMRLEFPLSDPHQGKLTQQIGSITGDTPDLASFVLDNDFSFTAIGLTDTEVWQRIEASQNLKNKIFLNSLTQKMKEQIS